MTSPLTGFAADQFAELRVQLERNFTDRRELGAGVCVIYNGRTVVDLWGGFTDESRDAPWERDTAVVVFSCTKGATALCLHVLASRGELDLDERVSYYWPGFERNSKHEITVRMCLNHQAGLPGVSCAIGTDDARDAQVMASLLADERPVWSPGTRYGYHALTFGWLNGEIVRRVAGDTIGSFFAREIAGPLNLEFWIMLPAERVNRVASVTAGAELEVVPEFEAALERGEPIQTHLVNSIGTTSVVDLCASPSAYGVEIPGGGGIATARGLAGMYASLLGEEGTGVGALVDADQLREMATVESSALRDCATFSPLRHSCGFQKNPPGRAGEQDGRVMMSESAFGHEGLGGSIGFADPDVHLAFGYVTNRHPLRGELMTDRSQALIDATYRAVGYRQARGRWVLG